MTQGPKNRFNQILTCLALSHRAREVLGESLSLAKQVGGNLTIVHAGYEDTDVRKQLDDLLVEFDLAVKPEIVIREGRPDLVICQTAQELGSDLIIAGAQESEGIFEGVFGSVARKIARRAPCPIMLLTEPSIVGSVFNYIVVSVQFDEESRQMLEYTLDFAHQIKASHLHIINESDYFQRLASRLKGSGTMNASEEELAHYTENQYALANFLEDFDLSGLEVETACLEGADGLVSVDYAKKIFANLLVFPAPSRPLTFWDRFLHHPAEMVMEKLPCAILLFRSKQGAGSLSKTQDD